MGPSAVSLAGGGEVRHGRVTDCAAVLVFTGKLVIKGRVNPVKLSINLMEH